MTPEGDFELAYLAADGTVRQTGGLPEPANLPETPAPVNPDQPQRPPRVPKDPPPRTTESAAVLALEADIALAATDAEREAAVDTFWRRVGKRGTPLVEAPWPDVPEDRAVTFLWRDRHGTGAGTRSVVLLLNKVTDPSVWEQSVLHRVHGTDVWHRTYRLPATWQATYQLAPDDGPVPAAETAGASHGPRSRWAGVASGAVADPFCRTQLVGRPGELPSSVAILDRAPDQPWRERRSGVVRGTLQEGHVDSPRLREPRRVWTYRPPATETGPVVPQQLLVLLDGEDWAGRLDVGTTLDNLHADGVIPPTAAVLVDAIGPAERWRDLACSDHFTDFLTGDLLAWVATELELDLAPVRVILTGRSLGGLTALYAGVRAPGRVHAVIAQSSSLWYPAEPIGEREPGWLAEQVAGAAQLPAHLTLQVGTEEWLLLGRHRELAASLATRFDTRLHLDEFDGGHDVWCWRGLLADALVRLARETGGPRTVGGGSPARGTSAAPATNGDGRAA